MQKECWEHWMEMGKACLVANSKEAAVMNVGYTCGPLEYLSNMYKDEGATG